MKDMQQGIARKMGGTAMTRRSIAAVLGSLLFALFVVSAPAVSADGPCDADAQGNCAVSSSRDFTTQQVMELDALTASAPGAPMAEVVPTISADSGCNAADADTVDQCVAWAASQGSILVASVGPAAAVPGIDYRFIELNTTTLPSATVANVAPFALADAQYGSDLAVLDARAANAVPALTMAQYQFIEMNTILPSAGAQTYMEDVTPIPGYPY
jgi:hypothetical protein